MNNHYPRFGGNIKCRLIIRGSKICCRCACLCKKNKKNTKTQKKQHKRHKGYRCEAMQWLWWGWHATQSDCTAVLLPMYPLEIGDWRAPPANHSGEVVSLLVDAPSQQSSRVTIQSYSCRLHQRCLLQVMLLTHIYNHYKFN